jgi:hypothetical protein
LKEKKYQVTGKFRLIDKDGAVIEDNISLNSLISASFPEAAKNKAFSSLRANMTKKYGRSNILIPKTRIKVGLYEQQELFEDQ